MYIFPAKKLFFVQQITHVFDDFICINNKNHCFNIITLFSKHLIIIFYYYNFFFKKLIIFQVLYILHFDIRIVV